MHSHWLIHANIRLKIDSLILKSYVTSAVAEGERCLFGIATFSSFPPSLVNPPFCGIAFTTLRAFDRNRLVYFPTSETAAICWGSTENFTPQDATTNVFIAAFTTAWARIKLYSEMDKLGQAVLYHDTDSIIYASNGENDPPLGNFLGDFTDELEGDTITTFVSGGPKNYAYETKSGEMCCKVRGFTLNFRNCQTLNFESIKKLVCEMDTFTTLALHNPAKITREAKRRKVINKKERKLYRLVYNKRVIQTDLTTLPYGY